MLSDNLPPPLKPPFPLARFLSSKERRFAQAPLIRSSPSAQKRVGVGFAQLCSDNVAEPIDLVQWSIQVPPMQQSTRALLNEQPPIGNLQVEDPPLGINRNESNKDVSPVGKLSPLEVCKSESTTGLLCLAGWNF